MEALTSNNFKFPKQVNHYNGKVRDVYNIDNDQLKNLNIYFDLKIKADLKDFFIFIDRYSVTRNLEWKNLKYYKEMNWIAPPKSKHINSYEFIRTWIIRG